MEPILHTKMLAENHSAQARINQILVELGEPQLPAGRLTEILEEAILCAITVACNDPDNELAAREIRDFNAFLKTTPQEAVLNWGLGFSELMLRYELHLLKLQEERINSAKPTLR